jgi:hypothetical protein
VHSLYIMNKNQAHSGKNIAEPMVLVVSQLKSCACACFWPGKSRADTVIFSHFTKSSLFLLTTIPSRCFY